MNDYLDNAGILLDNGKIEEAIALVKDILRKEPKNPRALHILAGCHKTLFRHDDAISIWQELVKVSPDFHSAWYNMGNTLREIGRLSESKIALEKACSLEDNPDYYCNLGIVAHELKDSALALSSLRHALHLQPSHVEANFALAIHHLNQKEWTPGFARYEWRKFRADSSCLDIPWPLWNGSVLNEKKILIHAEQGFGDVIHFARFIPEVLTRCKHVSLLCHPELKELMINSFPEITFYPFWGELPITDFQAPLLSLPFILKLKEFPQTFPYLKAFPLELAKGKKIGICWQGNNRFKENSKRSVGFNWFKPLLELSNTQIFSLQYGFPSPDPRIICPDIRNFQDTANLMSSLDLVITVDTSVANLAGALGIPGYVLVPFANDWRWGTNENNSFWYPSLRLIRAEATGWGEIDLAISPHSFTPPNT